MRRIGQEAVMRQEHRAGEMLFVSLLGANNYTFAETTWTQARGDDPTGKPSARFAVPLMNPRTL